MKARLSIIVIVVNAVAALALGLLVAVCVWLSGLVGDDGRDRQPVKNSDGSISVLVDKKTLMDREKSIERIKTAEKAFRNDISDPRVYLRLPESEFFRSLFAYYFLSKIMSAKPVTLDKAIIDLFKERGQLLYSMDERYPLMKKSIYLDPRRKTYNRPAIRPGTNVIIIFVESLSDFFLKEELHGLRGLTGHINEMGNESFSFTRMRNASFPTIRGLIAALGSGVYLLDENIGGSRIPIPCRFLFLSNILKKKGYTTIHAQAGSEHFIGMKDFFMKREGYDYFYGCESLIPRGIRDRENGFGVDDDVLFGFVVELLKKQPRNAPFLLTISTINSHPPFKVKERHPGSDGNEMIDAIHSTDRAFGEFWEYFKKSPHADNTVVILTADHAMGNNKQYIDFMKKHEDHFSPFFDIIPCYIHFPGGAYRGVKNDTLCTSMDLLPTLLEMMDMDLPNPFMGIPIFSERKYYKNMDNPTGAMKLDQATIAQAKKILAFYLNLYKEDRILPKDYSVTLH
ncbi:MAG TPA: LTA synthase family protein [Spirochaetota bacterium]|nr:LTA synthase family protein [Spirochaetota bacterium]HOD14006.1 LTA synthase family protein [Spirochaetota bacterium]HPN13206.1 LTA synthase family protein [Spirochaetota bacterium]